MRAGRVTAAFALLALAPRPAGADVADYLNKPVVSVRLVVEGSEESDPAVTSVVQTVVGRPLSMADVRETIGHLFSLRRFEEVRVDAEAVGDGVALRYELTAVHPVTRIEFAGPLDRPGVEASQLRRVVVERYGVSPSVGRASDLARVAAEDLAERGYLHASVETRTEIRHDPDRATLIFVVNPGVRTTLGVIAVDGTPGVSRDELLDELDVAEGKPYERGRLEAGLDRYLEGRHRLGYYLAAITPSVQLEDGDRLAHLTIAVDTGPLVRVRFAGDPVPRNLESQFAPVEREGSVDEDLLEDSSLRVEAYFRSQGYRDASAPFRREEVGGELIVTFDVTRGPLYRVSTVAVVGNASVPLEELAPNLRTMEGGPFSEAALETDVSVVELLYRRRGFASARAVSEVEPTTGGSADDRVDLAVRISVVEGVRTLVGSVTFSGNRSVDTSILQAVVGLTPDTPFVAAQLAAGQEAVAYRYADLGYPTAAVSVVPRFSEDGTRADVEFSAEEGPQVFVDHVLVVGNTRTSVGTIERELLLAPGDPVGRSAVVESQRRLSALGLFRRVLIEQVSHGEETRRDLIVTVEEAPATTIGYGAGVEGRLRVVRREEDGGAATEQFEVAPRASFEIVRRNLFGKNRSISFFSSLSLHPQNSPFFADQLPTAEPDGRFGFPEYRIVGTFREPRVADTAADLFVTATLEQQIRSSFNYARRAAGATVTRRVASNVLASGSYQLEHTNVFDKSVNPDDENLLDRTFSQYRLSSVAFTTIRDTRDDTLNPHAGQVLSANAQLAALSLGSEASFLKTFFTGQLFRNVPHGRGTVFAASARFGFGFPGEVVQTLENGKRVTVGVNVMPESERFFAGGGTTVRGFALDRLGTPETISDGFPIGGDGLVIFNGELRMPVWGELGVVGFVDTGNVFQHVGDIDLHSLRSSVGFGIRFGSPFGPIRADLGIKVNRHEGEGPTAFHLSFGQAF